MMSTGAMLTRNNGETGWQHIGEPQPNPPLALGSLIDQHMDQVKWTKLAYPNEIRAKFKNAARRALAEYEHDRQARGFGGVTEP